MRRLLLFLFLAVVALTSGQAQVMRGGIKAVRSATSASERTVRNIQQQSRRAAEQAARKAAAANRLKIKPFRAPVIVPNLDTDDQNRKKGGGSGSKIRPIFPRIPKLKPAPKTKPLNEMLDEFTAREYEMAKFLVAQGKLDRFPDLLFRYADYAKRHGDEAFAIECIGHISPEQLTPSLLKKLSAFYPTLSEYMPEISRWVTICAYTKMLEAKLQGTDCDSARMQSGDTLLIVTSRCNPSLNPLVVLSCFYDPSKEVERYKEAADSVTTTYGQWSDAFKDTFARDFALTLMDKKEYATALDYFGREPLKQFPDSLVEFALDMTSCAIATKNDSLFASYLEQALALDSVATNDYWTQLYNGYWEQFIADPSQIGLADWLLETAPMPANNALLLSGDLIERYWSENEYSWKWQEISHLTPEQITARRAILHILDKATTIDEGRSEPNIAAYSSYIKAELMLYDPVMVADAKSMLDNLTAIDMPDLRCRAIIGQVYIAAHGLDKPKEALKILKKNIKLLDDPAVTADARDMWYDYMVALATSLGKTKDAEKYRKLKTE